MNKAKRFFRRFGIDIAGYVCLLLVIPVGWLPGPGGIPLLVLSLTLLSKHNAWARKLLDYVKSQSASLRTIFFPKNPTIEMLWDIGCIMLFVSAFALNIYSDVGIFKLLGTAMGAGSTTAFMFNRGRLDKILGKIKRK